MSGLVSSATDVLTMGTKTPKFPVGNERNLKRLGVSDPILNGEVPSFSFQDETSETSSRTLVLVLFSGYSSAVFV